MWRQLARHLPPKASPPATLPILQKILSISTCQLRLSRNILDCTSDEPPGLSKIHSVMIVCHCTGATDREIRRAAKQGCAPGEAGQRCGGCCAEVTRLVNLEKAGQAPNQQTKSGGREQSKPALPPSAAS